MKIVILHTVKIYAITLDTEKKVRKWSLVTVKSSDDLLCLDLEWVCEWKIYFKIVFKWGLDGNENIFWEIENINSIQNEKS